LEKLKTKYLIDTRKKVNFNIELNEVENIYADSYFISEAFDDLIDNAIKYSKKDEDVEIHITSSYIEKDVQIIFWDNGIGISKNDQEIIFKKYERSMSVIKNQSKTTGFGLGLNYVYQVISAHKGTIKVNSRLGSFTEFIINLPHR
jgi:two-component system phosphate regulon sensor histidine kinase PhoR